MGRILLGRVGYKVKVKGKHTFAHVIIGEKGDNGRKVKLKRGCLAKD